MEQLSFLIIDDFFKPAELDSIWKELDFINSDGRLLPPHKTGQPNIKADGTKLKSNKGVFLETVYKDPSYSSIMKYINEGLSKERVEPFVNSSILYKNFYNLNYYSHLVSYYEQSDYYEPHTDMAAYTFIVWLYKEPKAFEGGELILNEIDNHKIEIKNNTAILFPSAASHQVLPVKMKNGAPIDQGYGRYAISCFLNSNPMINNLPNELKSICSMIDNPSYFFPMKFFREAMEEHKGHNHG